MKSANEHSAMASILAACAKPTIVKKFIAFMLAAISLVSVLVCGGYALMLNQHNLYTMTPDEKQEQWYREAGDTVARLAASEAAAMGPGECPQALAEQLYGFPDFRNREYYYVEVYHSDELVHTISKPLPEGVTYEYRFKPRYPKVVNIHTSRPDLPLPGTEPVRSEVEEVWVDSQKLYYELYYYDDGPTYTVMVTMTPEALRDTFYSNLATLYPYRHTLIWAAVVSLLLAISATVYLIWAAGRAKDGSVHLGGLNRMPLDLYLLLVGLVGYIPLMIAIALYAHNNSLTYFTATLLVLFGTIVSMLILALIYALAAQIKRGGGYWWRHTIIGACAVKAVKGISELLKMIQKNREDAQLSVQNMKLMQKYIRKLESKLEDLKIQDFRGRR